MRRVLAGVAATAVVALPLALTTPAAAADDAKVATLDVAVQTIDGLHSSPSSVPSGTADLGTDGTPVALGALALLGALGAGAMTLRARRSQV